VKKKKYCRGVTQDTPVPSARKKGGPGGRSLAVENPWTTDPWGKRATC